MKRIHLVAMTAACIALTIPAGTANAAPKSHDWYVRAGAAATGDGSRNAPFATLAAAQRASRPGDTIFVAPAATPLDGGIALKPRQRLVGLGGPAAAEITNSDATANEGAAVVLADDVQISNLHVRDTRRAGVVGHDVAGVRLTGNLFTGWNAANEVAVEFPPANRFQSPYPAIFLLADRRLARPNVVSGNTLRDAQGSGLISVTSAAARAELRIDHNVVRDINVTLPVVTGKSIHLEGFSLLTRDDSALTARIANNFYDNVGAGQVNADPNFFSVDGSSKLTVTVDRDVRRNSNRGGNRGGTHIEFWSPETTPGAKADITVSHADYEGAMSDGIQVGTWGNLDVKFRLVDSQIRDTGLGAPTPPPGVNLFNSGSCVNVEGFARAGTTPGRIDASFERDVLQGCASTGLSVQNLGDHAAIDVDVSDSVLRGNAIADLWAENLGTIDRFDVTARGSDFLDAPVGVAALDAAGLVARPRIDLSGRNRFVGDTVAVTANNLRVAAARDWWGDPDGPAAGQIVAQGTARVDVHPVLRRDPRP